MLERIEVCEVGTPCNDSIGGRDVLPTSPFALKATKKKRKRLGPILIIIFSLASAWFGLEGTLTSELPNFKDKCGMNQTGLFLRLSVCGSRMVPFPS